MDIPLVPGTDHLDWEQVNRNDLYASAVWQKLRSNDPSLTELYVGQTHGLCPRHGISWGDLGKAIGDSKHLQILSLSVLGPRSLPYGIRASWEDMKGLFKGIAKNRSIQHFFFRGGDFFEGRVFTLLTPLLKRNPRKSLTVRKDDALSYNYELEDNEIQGLSSALAKSSSVWGRTGLYGFQASGLHLNTEAGGGLIRAVSRHNLQTLILQFDVTVGRRDASTALSNLLKHSIDLDTLYFSYSGLDDECASLLATGLVRNSGRKLNYKLKRLDLSGNRNITSTGWTCIFGALERKDSEVTELWLENNDVFVGDCLFAYLRGNCRLATLHLNECDVDDTIMSMLAHCLVGNRTLRELQLRHNPAITSDGYSTLLAVLCNKSSIEDTFSSNHTLERVRTDADVPSTLAQALRVNEKNCDADAARHKILQIHFRVEQGLSPLYNMERNVWPFAMSWMAREESGFSLLFRFLQGAAGVIEFDWKCCLDSTTTLHNRRRGLVVQLRNALGSHSSQMAKRG